ncbi:SET methyltransferase domain containing protein [Nitzschia inconspicua]|uniref:SET methyltransferase domain containing protein n=1 Tax=Nitzschia inconspicua TaxID=303405 RepID=A0A9K3LDR3_9STRA|nr:SET methyltransferase domain containing protein [Nitzschia inconspicua]
MLDLTNIKSVHGSKFDEVVDRIDSPGAGAFTPYHSARTIVRVDQVLPGQELFASYGEEWIPWIPGVAVTQEANFDAADELMHEFEEWIEEHENPDCPTRGELTEELLQAMWKFMVEFPQSSRKLSVIPKEWSRERMKKATLIETQRYLGQSEVESPSREYWTNKGRVSLDFLRENGKCQDHIRPNVSSVPHAGRGAFATRDLPKGTVVGYSPLVHVAVRGEEIYTINYDGRDHGNENNAKKPFSRPDLILNYSFGHRNSTILLTPYGGYELVAHKPEWLEQDIDFLRDTNNKIGLSFDYVALRDIKQGEEVFMDYGDEWLSAA